MNKHFNRLWGDLETTYSTVTQTPCFRIATSEEAYTLTADFPGVEPQELGVTVENRTLTVKATRKDTEQTHSRRFSLPTTVDAERLEATLKHGVLRIVLPKTEAVKPRTIPVVEG
jgi:HSP20 family protein